MSDVFSHANGNESAALAVAKAEPEVVAEPVEAPAAEAAPAAPAETLDSLKLKAMAKISGLTKESPAVLEALAELVQKLETAAPPAPAPLEADTALAKLQAALAARGTHGIITLGKRFRSIDDDGDNKISFDEFRKALKEMEVILPEPDLHRLFRFFDADCSGYLSFDEFMVGLRGQLNARRQQMVDLAFKVLDKDNAGQITLAFIEKVYNAKMHPDVVLGIKSEREVLLEFMEVFEAQGGGQKGDGVITHDEFNRYYGSISASIDDDDYFELVIRNAWHISGGEGWCANTTCKRVLVLHTDGTQSVIEVKDDFYVNTKDVDAVKKALIEQGVKDIKGVALYGLPADIPSGDAPGTPAPPPAAAAAAAVGRAATPANSNRTHNMRSSIMFG